ncbi:MAG TPA: MFS transporter, partial [Lactobacillus sp.]|nr:MFS transporter [Lactobacillus sp.]
MTPTEAEKSGDVKLCFREKLGWGSGDLAQNLIFSTLSTYLLFFYTNVFGIPAADAATMFLVVRVIDMFTDPIIGAFVDGHNTRFGKYRGYILYMSVPLAAITIMCFYTPDLPTMGRLIYAYVTYVGVSVVYSTVTIPYASLNSAMTRNQSEIVSMNSVRMICSNLGALIVAFMVPVFVKWFSGGYYSGNLSRSGWFWTMVLYCAVGVGILMFTFTQTRERVHMDKSHEDSVSITDLFHQFAQNGPLRTLSFFGAIAYCSSAVAGTMGAYYMTYNAGNAGLMQWYNALGTLPAFFLVPFIPRWNKKFGTQRLMQLSLGVMVLGFFLIFITPAHNTALVMISRLVEACGMVMTFSFQFTLIPAVITYGEWKTGKRENGIVNAVYGFIAKLGNALGGAVPGYLLAAYGFNATAKTQTASTLSGIRNITALLPMVIGILRIIDFAFYRITDAKVEAIKKEIAERGEK